MPGRAGKKIRRSRQCTGYRLEAQIAAPQDDHRQGALQYLLLHEFGHVLAAGRGLLPEWWNDAQAMRETDDYLYLPLAWRITPEKEVVPLPGNDFPLRGDIAYYQRLAWPPARCRTPTRSCAARTSPPVCGHQHA